MCTPTFSCSGRWPDRSGGLAIQIDQRPKTARLTPNDRDHQRQSERPGSRERVRGAADADPNRQRILYGPRIDALSGQCRPKLAGPVHMLMLTDIEQESELFF